MTMQSSVLFSTKMLIIIVTIITYQHTEATEHKDRLYISHGVYLKYLEKVVPVTDNWQHTFHLKLPSKGSLESIMPNIRCARETRDPVIEMMDARANATNTRCRGEVNELSELLQNMYRDYNVRTRDIISHIYTLIPEYKESRISKRGLLNVGGDIYHEIFGLARDKDVQTMKDSLKKIMSGSSTVGTILSHDIDSLTSRNCQQKTSQLYISQLENKHGTMNPTLSYTKKKIKVINIKVNHK